jgi:WD40 repeat protein
MRLGTTRFQRGGRITGLAFIPDGNTLASTSEDGSVRLWEAATGKELRRIDEAWPRCLAVSRDGQTLATGNGVGVIRLWNAATGQQIARFEGHSAAVECVAFSSRDPLLASAGADGVVHLREITASKARQRIGEIHEKVRALAFSPDGRTLAVAGMGIHLWDVRSGKPLGHHAASQRFSCLAFAADGRILASGGEDKMVHLWEPGSGKEIRTLGGHDGPVGTVVFSSNATTLFSADSAGKIRVFDMATGRCLRTMVAREAAKTSGNIEDIGSRPLALSPDGKRLASAGPDNRVLLWDPSTGQRLYPTAPLPGPCTAGAWSADGKQVASAGTDGTVWVWDPGTGQELRHWKGTPTDQAFLAYSPHDPVLALGSPRRAVRLVDPQTGKERSTIPGPPPVAATCAIFTPTGKELVVGYSDGTIRLCNVATGEEVRRFTGPRAGIRALALTAEGNLLAASSDDDAIHLWHLESAKLERRWDHVHAGSALAFAPGGRALASGNEDGVISLWDIGTGREIRHLAGNLGAVYALAFAPDGQTMASCGYDSVVRLWEVDSGQAVAEFRGHAGAVRAVAFSPDGRRLLSGGSDATLLVWDTGAWLDPQRPGRDLADADLEKLWADLAGVDGVRAYSAVRTLAAVPRQSVPFARERLRAFLGVDSERIARLIAQLDDDRFAVREKASAELAATIRLAESALRRALEKSPSLEAQRRIEEILKNAKAGIPLRLEQLRMLRLLHMLAKAGTPEARQAVESLAAGTADADLKQEAKSLLAHWPGK